MTENYENTIYSTKDNIEIVWTLVSTAMIFFMQSGFALVETGNVRQKNAQSILIKNLFDSAVGCIGFYFVGYAFAFGNVNYFMGYDPKYFAASGFKQLETDNYKWWIFQYSFAATSATIVSGSLAERCQLTTYIFFSFFMTSFIYPVVVAWVWAENSWGTGWLKHLGYIDFAGSSVVHMVGGICALWGAKILGERYGKEQERLKRKGLELRNRQDVLSFDDKEFKKILKHVKGNYRIAFQEWLQTQTQEFKPHNPGLIVTGTLLLWVCWLFFNGGSASIFSPRRSAPSKVIMVNVISASSAGLFAGFFKQRIVGTHSFVTRFDVGTMCNGIIVGLVSVTASCNQIEVWAAFIIGIIGALFYSVGCLLLQKFNIDDPLEASPVHLGGGTWGTICAGLFSNQTGLFYNFNETGAKQLGIQLLGAASIMAWVSALSIPIFLMLNRLGLFRVPKEVEIMGLDIAELGGVNQEVYNKLRKDFSFFTPEASRAQSKVDRTATYDNIKDESNKDKIDEDDNQSKNNDMNKVRMGSQQTKLSIDHEEEKLPYE